MSSFQDRLIISSRLTRPRCLERNCWPVSGAKTGGRCTWRGRLASGGEGRGNEETKRRIRGITYTFPGLLLFLNLNMEVDGGAQQHGNAACPLHARDNFYTNFESLETFRRTKSTSCNNPFPIFHAFQKSKTEFSNNCTITYTRVR